MTEQKKDDYKFTRAMAIIAFVYSLIYIWRTPEPNDSVLWFLLLIIAIWAIGRASLIELMRIWKGQ
jgi:hypothetical protein